MRRKHCKSAKLPSHHNFVFFGLGQEVSESGQNHSLSSYSNVAVIECIPIAITAGLNQTRQLFRCSDDNIVRQELVSVTALR